jgi:hypothetical protein
MFVTFMDIVGKWIGIDNYNNIMLDLVPPEQGFQTILDVEAALLLNLERINVYRTINFAGSESFIKFDIYSLPIPTHKEYIKRKLFKNFRFMLHPQNIDEADEPLYFDSGEVISIFQFLCGIEQLTFNENWVIIDTQTPKDAPARGEEVQVELWTEAANRLTGPNKDTASLVVEKWKGKTHRDAYSAVFRTKQVSNPVVSVSKSLRRVPQIIDMFPDLSLLPPPEKK